MPFAGEAPAHAEVEELERVEPLGLLLELAQPGDLGVEALSALGPGVAPVEAAEVELVDDGQHEDLERHHVHLRAAGDDLEALAVGGGAGGDEVALEAEDAQEVDEVRADEAQGAEVGELARTEGRAQSASSSRSISVSSSASG
jgi:hypothetical protein